MIIHYDKEGNILGLVDGWIHDSVHNMLINGKKVNNIVIGKIGDQMKNEDQLEKAQELEKKGYQNYKIVKGKIV